MTTPAPYKPHQIVSAVEAQADQAVIPTQAGATVVSSDGARTYDVTAGQCTCPAGQHGRRCYHRLAARTAVQAATGRAAMQARIARAGTPFAGIPTAPSDDEW